MLKLRATKTTKCYKIKRVKIPGSKNDWKVLRPYAVVHCLHFLNELTNFSEIQLEYSSMQPDIGKHTYLYENNISI